MRAADVRAVDEESLALRFDLSARRREGRYFTPSSLVDFSLQLASAHVPRDRALAIVDPSCGAGAFLFAARRFFPRARLFGLELSEAVAAQCRRRIPAATVMAGDALRGDLPRLLEKLPPGAYELWLGNPPYNGTSSVLQDSRAYRAIRDLLPASFSLPPGTSLRDDFAFFLLLAAARLRERPGTLAFITSATLLDAYLYSELRRTMLDALSLREVVDLGRGAFAGTRVRTCLTIWRSKPAGICPPRFRKRSVSRNAPFEVSQIGPPAALATSGPDWALKLSCPEAEELDRRWRLAGEPLTALVPISFPGLKTRFDELLVDEDRRALMERLESLAACSIDSLSAFAAAHDIPERCLEKLRIAKLALERQPFSVDVRKVRRFFRYAGAKHRGAIPRSARAYCYLDRRLIPRGDHRLRGDYDPHACPVKLVFNVRELPLCAALLEEAGCVHDHRHTRFAPLFVPALILAEGIASARSGKPLGAAAPNLSLSGRALAARCGGPRRVFRMLVDFINGRQVQDIWAPAFGTARELPVPIHRWLEGGVQM